MMVGATWFPERAEDEPIECSCGCGTALSPVDREGRGRFFINGHNVRKGPYLRRPKGDGRDA